MTTSAYDIDDPTEYPSLFPLSDTESSILPSITGKSSSNHSVRAFAFSSSVLSLANIENPFFAAASFTSRQCS